MRDGRPNPDIWGNIITCGEIAVGIYEIVGTKKRGLEVPKALAEEILPESVMEQAAQDGENLCFTDPVSNAIVADALLEQELYPLLTSYLWSELHLYSMRIREGRSHNTRGNGGNQWLHPDIVAMEPVDKAWGKHVKACGHASGSTCVRLWSFEVKKTLTVANIRKCFFQAVSNSSWAHEGYLVATAIADDRVEQELRMLSALHGIGVILLDPENPSESEILLPAQKKPDADWQSIDRLAKENGDFHEFIELVSVYFQTGTLREKDWDNKTA